MLRPNLNKRMQKAFAQLAEVKDIVMVFGFVNQTEDGQRYNSAAVMKDGQVLGVLINIIYQTMASLMKNVISKKAISIWCLNILDISLVY